MGWDGMVFRVLNHVSDWFSPFVAESSKQTRTHGNDWNEIHQLITVE